MPLETMRAAVLHGKEDVRVESIPIPSVGPGEVRIRIRAALTCGTDFKVFRRGYHARMIQPPAVFGHELAGEIDELGYGVTLPSPSGRGAGGEGLRVVAANSAPCGECFYCLKGREELCEDLLFVNGAYAEYITIPERVVRKNLLPIPDHVSYESAALVEPLACVVNGLNDTDVSAGDTVVVVGVGPIGLMFVRLCANLGARVIAVGRSRKRLKTAESLGASLTLSVESEDDIVESVRRETQRARGADRVIECVGRPEVWEQAIAMSRKAGMVNLFGGCERDTEITVKTGRIHYDEVTLKGTFHHTPSTVRKALDLISSGIIDSSQFVEREADLSELPQILQNGSGSFVKVAIRA